MSQSSLVRTPKPSLTYRLVSSLLVFPVFRLLFRGSTAGGCLLYTSDAADEE